MEQADNLKHLISFLSSEGIKLSPVQQEKMTLYHTSLIKFAEKHRIISKNDIAHIVNKHFISSFYFVKEIAKVIKEKEQILDLGSGAGFPGIILAIYFNENQVTLIDSSRKKALFLKRVSEELNIKAIIINERIENYLNVVEKKVEFITARALASIKTLVELTQPLLKTSILHTIKGNDFSTEFANADKKIKISSFEIAKSWRRYSAYLDNKVYLTINSL